MSKPAHGALDPSDPQYMPEGQRRAPQTELDASSATLDQFARANYDNTCYLIDEMAGVKQQLADGTRIMGEHAMLIKGATERVLAIEQAHRDEAMRLAGAEAALAPGKRRTEIFKNICVAACATFVVGAVGWLFWQFAASTHPTTATQSTTLTTTVSPPPKAN